MKAVATKQSDKRKIVITDVGVSIHQSDGRILGGELIFCDTRGLDIIDQRNNNSVVYQSLSNSILQLQQQ